MSNQVIEIIGWLASIILVGSYMLNILGKIPSNSYLYIIGNLLGGLGFTINTFYHKAYPSSLVNLIWVCVAIYSIIKSLILKRNKL